MEEKKSLEYNWELGKTEIALEVAEYMHGNGLYIGMLCREPEGWDYFGDLTVNLTHAPLFRPNEAYISHDFSEDKIAFIEKHRLGKVLPETASSGFCIFQMARKAADVASAEVYAVSDMGLLDLGMLGDVSGIRI